MTVMTELPLTRRDRLRRVALLCVHCIKNLAYYRAGWSGGKRPFDKSDLLHMTINGNFLDVMVLEWCKLFVDREKHSWRNVVTDQELFLSGLLTHLGCTEEIFDDFLENMRAYRDKFVAHLDNRRQGEIPAMDFAKQSAIYYHRFLLEHENDEHTYAPNLHFDIAALYDDCEAEVREFYRREFALS